MKALIETINRISETQTELRRLESFLGQYPNRVSLQEAYKSLEKRHDDLELEFQSLAKQNHLDICSYRFYGGEGNYPISAFGGALKDFQKWFSTTYDGLKTGPKKRARLGVDIIAESTLNFAYSVPGSIGVVMTIPIDRQLFGDHLQRTMLKTVEMLSAKESEQIKALGEEVGVASIRAMYAWVENHVNTGLGADIHWLRDEKPLSTITAGFEDLLALRDVIEKTSDKEETTFEIRGLLVGADTSSHTFHMVFPEAEETRGRMSESIGESYTLELPHSYVAQITKTSSIKYATEEEKVSYFLRSLKKV